MKKKTIGAYKDVCVCVCECVSECVTVKQSLPSSTASNAVFNCRTLTEEGTLHWDSIL